jgi:hypothetical protein
MAKKQAPTFLENKASEVDLVLIGQSKSVIEILPDTANSIDRQEVYVMTSYSDTEQGRRGSPPLVPTP